MKVIIPVISLEKGGGTRFLHEIGSGLSDYGHDVQFVIVAGNRVEYAPRTRMTYVAKLVPEAMPAGDIVLPNFYLTVYASLSGRAMPARICLSYEPLFVENPQEAAQTYKIPMPIATISGWLQQTLLSYANRHSIVINPGIDHAVFHPTPVPRDPNLVVCIGRAREQGYGFKGYSQFVQAITLVKTERPDVRVVITSPDLTAHQLPFNASLIKTPTDIQLADLFRQASVFVFPSLFEGFGLPPLEAMACGTPVVTTACGGVSDYARDGDNCLMVQPDNVGALAGAIIRLLGDPPLRRCLSDAGVETARPWTWTRTVDQMENFLYQVRRGNYLV